MVDILPDKPWTRLLLASLLVAFICLMTGAAIVHYPATYTLGFTGLCVAGAVAWWNRGVLTGILVLFLLQGVPLINTHLGRGTSQGGNALNDAIFVVLALFLVVCAFDSIHNKALDRLAMLAIIWAACYLTWWLYKIIAGSRGIPILGAVEYGREFMGFSILLPAMLLALRRRKHLAGLAITLAGGAALFSIGLIVTQVVHTQLSWLIHVEKVAEIGGIIRIYAPMNELLIAVFPMSFAAILLADKRRRNLAVSLTVLTGIANALLLTRAIYVSELLAIFLVSLVWARGAGWQSHRIRKARTAFVLGIIAVAFAILIAGESSHTTGSSSSSPIQAVVSRAEEGVGDVQNQTGSTGVRIHEANVELEVLGDHWIAGLGFLSPAYYYAPGLRQGSIRNDDLGSLSIVMTMGLIGLLLAYMPPIAGLVYLLRRRHGFIQYGGAMYLSAALIGSITLGAFSTLPGLLVLGSILPLCLNWTALDTSTI